MAEQQIKDLKDKLEQQEAEFERYKAECKQLETFLESESTKKQEQIRKLKQEAILKQKTFGPMKAQVSQLETENAKLKEQVNELKVEAANAKAATEKSEELSKQVDELKKKVSELTTECEGKEAKIVALQNKAEEPAKGKGKSEGNTKKLEEALSEAKSRISELEKQNQKLQSELAKKHSIKEPKTEEKKVEKDHDNKQEQRLRQKVEKLQKKLAQSQGETNRAEEKNLKLGKQIKQLKERLAGLEAEREGLARRVKELVQANSARKQEVIKKEPEDEQESQMYAQQNKQLQSNPSGPLFSSLILTKKHYASPFLEYRNDNSIKVYKSTKNGFEKSMGSMRYRLNEITHNHEEFIEGCVKNIKENIGNGVKCSIVLLGPKKTTKKYLLANLVNKLREFLMEKIGESEEQPQIVFVKASPDPEKKLELVGHSREEIEEIFNKITEMAQKSPKKPDPKKKSQPRPKARYLKITQGQLYLEIITSSFTNVYLRQSQTLTQALHSIAYSRLPNALQPTDCFRQFLLILNPIVSLYDECKNTLSIVNCKRTGPSEEGNQMEMGLGVRGSPIKEELNQQARRKLESIERESEQSQLKIRKQEEEIGFYRGKFDELELRLKNLLNTHRQQNSYLKKSPVTLSYEKMLKFVHSVQAKNPSTPSPMKIQQNYSNIGEEVDNDGEGNDDYGHQEAEVHEDGSVGDIL